MNLEQALEQAGYRFSVGQIEQFQRYRDELFHWNKTMNLTAIRENDFTRVHLLDSLSILNELSSPRVLDMGTGGGLPGIPLAIACPENAFTLLDARNKKIQFLEFIKNRLNLKNIQPTHQRAEDHHPAILYDSIVTRAFSSLAKIYRYARPLTAQPGRIIAMKGQYPHDELIELDHMRVNYEVKSLSVPGLHAQRHVIIIDIE